MVLRNQFVICTGYSDKMLTPAPNKNPQIIVFFGKQTSKAANREFSRALLPEETVVRVKRCCAGKRRIRQSLLTDGFGAIRRQRQAGAAQRLAPMAVRNCLAMYMQPV